MKFFTRLLLLACLWLPVHVTASAVDRAREGALAAQLTPSLQSGHAVWLESSGGRFLGIETDSTAPARLGGVVLLHDLDAHPDWPRIISPLRQALPETGWQSLSIQLPLLTIDTPLDGRALRAIHEAGADRVKAAIDHLIGQGIDRITLIGHGMGAAVMGGYLAGALPETHATAVKSFVAIRARHTPGMPPSFQPDYLLERTALPVLDIISGQENAQALAEAKKRKAAAASAHNARYRQLVLPWPDNDFAGTEALLIARVGSWLKRHASEPEGAPEPEATKSAD